MKTKPTQTQISVVLEKYLKNKIVESAKKNDRSMNREIISILKKNLEQTNGQN